MRPEPRTGTWLLLLAAHVACALLALCALLLLGLLLFALSGDPPKWLPLLWTIFAVGVAIRNFVASFRAMLDPSLRAIKHYALWSLIVLVPMAVLIALSQ